MGQFGGGLIPALRVLLHRFVQHGPLICTQAGSGAGRRFVGGDRTDQFVQRPVQRVGRCAREHLVSDDTERVDIGSSIGVGGFAGDLLRCGVRECSCELAGAGQGGRIVGDESGDAEVQEAGSALPVDEDVRGGEVPVYDAVGVRVLEGVCDLREHAQAFVDVRRFALGPTCYGFAEYVFHDDRFASVVEEDGVDEAHDRG